MIKFSPALIGGAVGLAAVLGVFGYALTRGKEPREIAQPASDTLRTEAPNAPLADTPKIRVPERPLEVPNNATKGDFNGDGKPDRIWLEKPEIDETGMECVGGSCVSYIFFSDPALPYIAITDCIDGTPDNLGDLNGDGTDEIGLLPGRFTSCWNSYLVWSWKNGRWTNPIEPILTHCDQWEKFSRCIEKDPAKKGHVLVRYSEHTDEEILVKKKSLPFE
jgi:hypothetical protein